MIFLVAITMRCSYAALSTTPLESALSASQETDESTEYVYVNGVMLPHEITGSIFNAVNDIAETNLGEDVTVVDQTNDLLGSFIQTQRDDHIIFACDITYYSGNQRGYGNIYMHRLCHMPTDDDPRLIKSSAYSISNGWSPDGTWFVFAGAADGMALCEQRLYAYNILTGGDVSLMPESDPRIFSMRPNLQWEMDNGVTWILFEAWTGGEQSEAASYTPYRIRFLPNQ